MLPADQISFDYLQSHPVEAAQVLESLPLASIAALLDEIPVRLCIPVVQAMQPTTAAACLELLATERQAGLLNGLGFQVAAAVLRQFDPVHRPALLDRLPSARALVLRALLAYPQDTVGAWMQPQVVSLPLELSAAAALDRVRAGVETCPSPIFVTANQDLRGKVELSQLLRADGDTGLESLIESCRHSLSARASLHSVLEHAEWEIEKVLPVVGHGGRFVGVLEFNVLLGALQHGLGTGDADSQRDAVSGIAAGYWNVTAGILDTLVALLPAGSPLPEAQRDR